MKQLGNQDAGFIYNETPTTPMHIAGLGIYDQSTAPGKRLGHKDILKYVEDRIHLAPIFRYKYVEVPFGLDKPYWIEDPDFDVEFHVRHIALPQPGDWRQLCIMVSRLNSRPLDFNHPLWEAYIIEGLDNIEGLPKGSFAIMVKVHHSIVDGASGQGIFGALHDLTPDAKASLPAKPLTVDREPTAFELVGRAMPNMVKNPLRQTLGVYRKAPNLIRNAIKLYQGTMQSGTRLRVPQTRFNYNLSPHRVFEGTNFDLDEVKYIKNVVGQGTSVNDVMLAIVSGALRHYLNKHDELPDESLSAMLPQDVRSEESLKDFGSQVGGIFSDIHTHIENFIDRLIAIHDSTTQAKQFAIEMDTSSIVQNYMGGFLSPRLGRRLNHTLQKARVMERFGPFVCNTMITNVPGPNFPLYHAGAKMVAYWGIPPVMDCLGLSHAVFSYCGRISLSALACRQMMPDPAFYAECMEKSFEELLKAAKDYEADKNKPASTNNGETKTISRKRAASSSASASHQKTAATTAKPAAASAEKVSSKAVEKKPAAAKKASSTASAKKTATPAKASSKTSQEKPAAAAKASSKGSADAAVATPRVRKRSASSSSTNKPKASS